MEAVRLGWSIVWRMAVWGLALGAGLGFVYGPLSEMVLEGIAVAGGAADLGGMWWPVLIGSCGGGILFGGFMGLPAGVVAGAVMATVGGMRGHRWAAVRSHRILLCAIGAISGGLITLFNAVMFNLPAMFAPLLLPFAWVLWEAIPALIAGAAGWWAARRVLAGADLQPRPAGQQ